MTKDVKKHRRQVAWFCFEPYLTEPQLLKAIEILEQGYQTDSVSNLIAYVSKICGEFGIGAEIRKELYAKFYDLMSKDVDDLIDPLLLVEAERQAQFASSESKLMRKPVGTDIKLPPQASMASQALGIAEPTSESVKPELPAAVVFVGLLEHIVEYVSDQTEFIALLSDVTKSQSKEIQQLIGRWSVKLIEFDWVTGLSEPILAEIIHCVYTVLCEMIGPVGADNVFHKAIAKCQQIPEAKQFPPTRFL